jgi:hypothetical protein
MTLSWVRERRAYAAFASVGASSVVWAEQVAEPVAFAAKEAEHGAQLGALVTSSP